MKHFHLLTILILLAITTISACSSEKRESSILENKVKERVEAVNKFYKGNGQHFGIITITSPIKVSLNLKENSAVTDTEMKLDIPGYPVVMPVRIVWRKYQDGDWQIEFITPAELSMALMMDKMFEQYKKVRP